MARIILALYGVTDPKNRQAHYRDGDRYNLLPENLYLGEVGYLTGSDAAWQEVERRKCSRRKLDSNPDIIAAEIIGDEPQPPQKRVEDEGVSPVYVPNETPPRHISDGVAGGSGNDG